MRVDNWKTILMKKTFFYLHRDGALIENPASMVEKRGMKDYFDSPFVVKYWIATKKSDVEKIKKEAEKLNKENDSN